MSSEFCFCPACAAPLALQSRMEDGGEKARMRCTACDYTHWNNPTPVLAAVIEYQGKILLARNAAWSGEKFALITGFMEAAETPRGGIEREIKEETNLDADSIALICVYEFIRKNELIIAYHVRASGQLQLSPELVEVRLVAPEKLKPWRAGTGYAMADWMRARGLQVEFIDWGSQAPDPN